jgi:CBS-domain-containing membrane protein
MQLKNVMTKNVKVIPQKADKLTRDRQIRRLPVINHQNEPVGIVSLGDISLDVGKDKLSGETLEEISKPSKPKA